MEQKWTARRLDITTSADLEMVVNLIDVKPECIVEGHDDELYGLFEQGELAAIFAGPRAKMAHTAQMFFNSISDRLPEELRRRFSTEG